MDIHHPVCKVLVLDTDETHAPVIKRFCDDHHLVPLKVSPNRLLAVLRSNIDLGAILCSEDFAGSLAETTRLALRIHQERPELPIMLRRTGAATLEDLDDRERDIFCVAYHGDDLGPLRLVLDQHVFSLVYPNALVRGIAEITQAALVSQLPDCELSWSAPSIVRDRIIFGEVFSLIPLESGWCRGYMMLQTEEAPLLDLIARRSDQQPDPNFRRVNSLLGETTNLIWGAFKNRFIGDVASIPSSHVQVPLVVNHHHKYISFGTENPQLCFAYRLRDPSTGRVLKLYQRFVFNLNWSPEEFRELTPEPEQMVDSGELELF